MKNKSLLILIFSFFFISAGLLLSLVFPLSKSRVSSSYILLSFGFSLIVYLSFFIMNDRVRFRIPFLKWWGTNPLFLYLCHFLLMGFIVLPGIPELFENASAFILAGETLALYLILSFIAWFFYRKRLFIIL